MTFDQQKSLEDAYLMHTYGRKPVQLVSGRGMVVVDDAGKEYLDFVSGVGAVSLGHCHPAIVEALKKQAETLIHVSNYYYIEKRGEVAQMLSGLLSAALPEDEKIVWKTFFANTGAEANECAIKLARLHARRVAEAKGEQPARTIVTLKRSFHGRTLATLAATAQPVKQEAFQPLPGGFTSSPINDLEALTNLFEEMKGQICAVMVEPIQGECGVYPCSPEFLAGVRELCDANGALLIADEVQCGIFRTAKPFGFQHLGVTPDIVTIAKGVASGFPTGMCAARAEIADTYQPGDHGSTFGGSCLAVAAAHATLSTLVEGGFEARVEEVGAYMREKLAELPHVKEVRGYGLMLAAELDETAPAAGDVVAAGLDASLLLNTTGPTTLRFLPPLVCEKADVDALVEKLAVLLGA
ncbi:MAG: aspartate aminotransferase family protein [Eggerthellaceae bacterium]|nr:aspartate aminotransferase family protein [Eggerthellaceae bacterium]